MPPVPAALPPALLFVLLAASGPACSGPIAEETSAVAESQTLVGTLVIHIVDVGQDRITRYGLRLPSGAYQPVDVESAPDLPSGTPVAARGREQAGRFVVEAIDAIEATGGDLATSPAALLAGTTKPTRRWAFILMDIGAGVNLDRAAAEARLFGDDPSSIRSYFREASYGLQDLTGEVFGPFRFTAATADEICELSGAEDMVNAILPRITGTFDQYLWYLGSELDGCPWEGVAELGSAARPTRHSFYQASSACTVLVQEPGHNFGMVHSSAIRCQQDGKRVTMIAAGQGACEHLEYGHPYDPMGSGCGHMNGVQKAYQGWLEGCNLVTATGSGTFTLFPLERACDGPQLLQIPLPTPRFRFGDTDGAMTAYYLEYRVPTGLDRDVPGGVYVMAAGSIQEARRAGNDNWLLDMNPDTAHRRDLAMVAGQSFRDPAPGGPAFTVVSADADKAVIRVELGGMTVNGDGAGVCADDRPFDAQAAGSCASPPTPVEPAPAPTPELPPALPPVSPPSTGVSTSGAGTNGGSSNVPGPDAGAVSAAAGADAASAPKVQGSSGCSAMGDRSADPASALSMGLFFALVVGGLRRFRRR